MDNVNNSCNTEEEEAKHITSLLLTDMMMKAFLMRQQHLAKLNRERVRQCRERKQQGNINEYVRK
ncbi:unnamed protein product, partial [Rotaria sp. Silwood1]